MLDSFITAAAVWSDCALAKAYMLLSVLNRKWGLICAFRKDNSACSFSLAISFVRCSERSHRSITLTPVLKTKTIRKMTRLPGLSSGRLRGRGGRSEPGRTEVPATPDGPGPPGPAERLE